MYYRLNEDFSWKGSLVDVIFLQHQIPISTLILSYINQYLLNGYDVVSMTHTLNTAVCNVKLYYLMALRI